MKQRDCEAEPDPTYVSLTIGDLVKRLKSTGDETSEGYDTKSEGYKTGGESDFDDEQEQVAKLIFFLFKAKENLENNSQF